MTQLKKSLTPIGGAALMLNIVIGAGLPSVARINCKNCVEHGHPTSGLFAS